VHHLLFFDGECGLCDRFVQHVLENDTADRFRLAPLQSAAARAVLADHGVVLPTDRPPGTLYLRTADGRLLDRSDAALFVLGALGTGRRFGALARLFPRPLRELGYRLVSRSRFALFGRMTCKVPTAEHRRKFLEA
jgi:predicted DCC family thiol-disulfide oxidoreductase YuxK